jgi:hypothetical protein
LIFRKQIGRQKRIFGPAIIKLLLLNEAKKFQEKEELKSSAALARGGDS